MRERDEGIEHITYNEPTLRALLQHSSEGVVILSSERKPLYISPSIKNILGYTEAEVMKTGLAALTHPDDILPIGIVLEQVLASPGIPLKGHTGRILHKDGTWRWIETTITNLLDDPFVLGIVNNFRDITQKKVAAERLIHANQLYSFLSQVNQAIVHSKTDEQLFNAVCNTAIQFGHFKVGWVGIFDADNEHINLVSQAGLHPEDLPNFAHAFCEAGGPQDHVLSTKNYFICNDVQADLELIDWKSFAIKRGYCSAMILPISKGGKLIGTINVYATEPDFFKEQETTLLIEAAGDISFALDVFEKEQLRIEVVARLQKSESNLSAVIENTDASIYSLDRELRYITFNKILKDNLKHIYQLEIQPGDRVYDFLEKMDEDEARGWKQIYARALAGETVKFEKEFTAADFYHAPPK